jgi:hypothetical protein
MSMLCWSRSTSPGRHRPWEQASDRAVIAREEHAGALEVDEDLVARWRAGGDPEEQGQGQLSRTAKRCGQSAPTSWMASAKVLASGRRGCGQGGAGVARRLAAARAPEHRVQRVLVLDAR